MPDGAREARCLVSALITGRQVGETEIAVRGAGCPDLDRDSAGLQGAIIETIRPILGTVFRMHLPFDHASAFRQAAEQPAVRHWTHRDRPLREPVEQLASTGRVPAAEANVNSSRCSLLTVPW